MWITARCLSKPSLTREPSDELQDILLIPSFTVLCSSSLTLSNPFASPFQAYNLNPITSLLTKGSQYKQDPNSRPKEPSLAIWWLVQAPLYVLGMWSLLPLSLPQHSVFTCRLLAECSVWVLHLLQWFSIKFCTVSWWHKFIWLLWLEIQRNFYVIV